MMSVNRQILTWKTIALLAAMTLILGLASLATAALAIVDPFVPANECNTPTGGVGAQAVLNGGIGAPGSGGNEGGIEAPVPKSAAGLDPSNPPASQGIESATSNCA